MVGDLNACNVFSKKRAEELRQRLQEQNELTVTQRQQIEEFTSQPLNSVIKPKGNPCTWPTWELKPPASVVPMNAAAPQTLDVNSSLTTAQGRENEQKLNNNKIHLRKALRITPLTKEVRTVLEQSGGEIRNLVD